MSQTRSEISRRRFVAGTIAAGATAVAGASPETVEARGRESRRRPARADVIVVEAGLAGLSAARAIRRAGRSVIVLEARERVGGRCFSRSLGAGASDVANMGATFVGPTQHQILGLMAELGISRFPVYATGKLLWYEDGKGTPYTGIIPPSDDPQAVIQLGTVALPKIDSMAKTVPLDAPYDAPQAKAWDSITVDSWAEQNISSTKGRAIFALAVEAVLSVEPRDISLLYFLAYVHAAGGVTPLIANAGTGGAQDYRVTGGTQRIAIELAAKLGGSVRLGHPVREIDHSGSRVTVSAEGLTVSGNRVVVAIPPHLAGRIFYSPALPGLREQLTQRMPIGSLIKTIAVYDRPFWRAHGLNGQANSDFGPVKVTFDASPASGTPGVLLGFIDGDDARVLSDRSARARARAAIGSLVRLFGSEAAHPRRYFDQVWQHEPYTGGCPVGVMPPGVMTEYSRALRAPVGPIHWAGTETATVWTGYMDGAVQSGKRAAAEALKAL